MSILKVKASGSVTKKPDKILLMFKIIEEDKTYEDTLKKGCELTSLFILSLSKYGLKKEDIKTNGFSIREVYVAVESKKDMFSNKTITKKEIDRYQFTQYLQIEMDLDLQKLSELVESTSKMKNPPKINISFGLKDIENAKTEALEKAFIKCKEKAEVLAKISGKQIKDCIEINYDVPYNYNSYTNCVCEENSISKMKSASLDLSSSIVPNDIEISENIITIWEV